MLACAHSRDNSCSARNCVAACVYALAGGKTCLVLSDDTAVAVNVKTLCGVLDKRIGRCTDRHNYAVYVKYKLGIGLYDRLSSAGSVRLAKLHFNALDAVNELVLAAEYLNGIGKQLEDNALFLSVLDLFLTCGKLFLASAVYYVNLLGAETLCAACCVHCNVTAADNSNLLVLLDRRIAALSVSLHEVYAGKELVCGIYALEVLAGDIHKSGKTCAGADEDSIIALLEQLVDSNGLADHHIGLNIYAQSGKVVDFLLNDRFGKSEFGDTVNENASCKVESLENSYLVACLGEIARTGKTGRTGTDNSDLLAVGLGLNYLALEVCIVIVRSKSLKTADTYRLALDASYALAFALVLLGTNTSADSGKGAGLGNDLESFLELAVSDLLNELGDLDIYGTARYTGHILAVKASLSLVHSHFLGVSESNLQEVLVSYVRLLGRHRIFL